MLSRFFVLFFLMRNCISERTEQTIKVHKTPLQGPVVAHYRPRLGQGQQPQFENQSTCAGKRHTGRTMVHGATDKMDPPKMPHSELMAFALSR